MPFGTLTPSHSICSVMARRASGLPNWSQFIAGKGCVFRHAVQPYPEGALWHVVCHDVRTAGSNRKLQDVIVFNQMAGRLRWYRVALR